MKVLILTFLFFTLTAYGRELECSTPKGEFNFSVFEKSGGAAPYPGMLIAKTEWTFQGSTIYLKRNYVPCEEWIPECEYRPDSESNIAWSEVEGTRAILAQEGELPYFSRTTYAAKMTLYSLDNRPMNGLPWTTLQIWMICEEVSALYP